MAGPTKVLIYGLVRYYGSPFHLCNDDCQGMISWPVAKLLEFALGPHHGIIYRRAGISVLFWVHCHLNNRASSCTELKELIAMHSHGALHGGDLKTDTVTIIGATLDLQEKVVKQVTSHQHSLFLLPVEIISI
jgi:metal transporter CNNM